MIKVRRLNRQEAEDELRAIAVHQENCCLANPDLPPVDGVKCDHEDRKDTLEWLLGGDR